MTQHYSNPKRANDAHALPDVETFQVTQGASGLLYIGEMIVRHDAVIDEPGWYWWSCFPGCMPDGEPNGPFATETEAVADAQQDAIDESEEQDCVDCDGSCEGHDSDEPQEDDYYLSDDERSILYHGKVIAGPVSADADPCPRDAVMRELRAYMQTADGRGYWPNVWSISDHGNATLISVIECGCYFTEHDGDASKCERVKDGVR